MTREIRPASSGRRSWNSRPDNTDQVVVRVKNGTLLIFPAYLHHSVDANMSEKERISISFNIMFSSFTENLSKPLW